MEIKLVHILGPVLALVAMLFYGRVMVRKSRGRSVRVMPALLMIVIALGFRHVSGDGTFLDRICLMLMDFGIALIIDSAYLSYHRNDGRVFWVPGVLALIVSFGVYFVASLFGWTVSGLFDGGGDGDFQDGQVLIELGPDDEIGELKGVLAEYGAEYRRAFPHVTLSENEDLAQYYLIKLPDGREEAFMEAARKDKENVDHADWNFSVKLELPGTGEAAAGTAPATAYFCDDPGVVHQWWLQPLSANRSFALLNGNAPKKKAKIAIIDTGIDSGHEDLKGAFLSSPGSSDQHGHGTHCAGLAGAVTHNTTGMASLNWQGRFVEVMGYQALSDEGHGSVFTIANAITQAAEADADVISLSLGSNNSTAPKITRDAIAYALSRGCIVVAAAGNNSGEDARNHSPSNVKGVIAVAATKPSGHRAPFSNINTGLAMPIAAPGAQIWSTLPDGKYDYMSGTSMATPLVAGLLGILRAYDPDITAAQAWELLRDHGTTGPDATETGVTIDPHAAITAVLRR